jgi:glycosyltransferase involved in cell wall biosynthesis
MVGRPTVALISDATGFGGAEIALAQLASYLREDWRFVAFLPDDADPQTASRMTDAGAEVRRVKGMRRVPTPFAIWNLVAALRELDPTIVHVGLTDQGDGLGPLLATALSRRPSLATLHLVVPDRKRWRETVSGFALRRPGLVAGVSESVAAYVRGTGAETAVIFIGPEPSTPVADPRAELQLPGSAFVVGGIGRLDRQKGWDVLCRAMPIVQREAPDTVAIVLGDGPERSALAGEEACASVRFAGYRERAASFVAAFDVLVVPSRYEAFGLVAVEAMLAGVPVIASAVDGLPEVVGDCGILVPPDQPDALAAAIVSLIGDPPKRRAYAESALARVQTLFTADRTARDLERLYQTLTS